MPPPSWGISPPSTRPFPTGGQDHIARSSKILIAAAILHGIAAPVTWFVMDLLIRQSLLVPEMIPILYLVAAIGVAGQLAFAGASGFGAYVISKGGPNLAATGGAFLAVGIVALIFSIIVSGGLLGIVGGFLTAYAGYKVRAPPRQAWIPPSSWMPPTQPPPPKSP